MISTWKLRRSPASGWLASTTTVSVSSETTPYALRNADFFYVADNPFLFINPRDRYLILADFTLFSGKTVS